MSKAKDRQFTDERLTRVEQLRDGWAITGECGTLCIPRYSATPRVGDHVRYYGRGFGYPVRGVDIAGVEVYYSTEKQYRDKQAFEKAASDAIRRADYAVIRDENTARINTLPAPCQKRLFQFRERNPDFGWEHEGYELECSTIAARIAQAFERRDKPTPADKWFAEWRELTYEQQVAICGPDTGWSGNMMGFATRQAYLLVTNPDLVPKDHAALCVLSGCDGIKVCDAYWHKHHA